MSIKLMQCTRSEVIEGEKSWTCCYGECAIEVGEEYYLFQRKCKRNPPQTETLFEISNSSYPIRRKLEQNQILLKHKIIRCSWPVFTENRPTSNTI